VKAALHRKLTVLQVIPRLHAGGAELGCVQIAEALVAAGHRAIVASQGGRMVEQLKQAGAEHVTLPLASKNPLVMLLNIRRLARLVQGQSVDIVHARSRAPAWSALFAARMTGIAFVTTYHGAYGDRGRLKNFFNGVMARGDMVIANSEFTARLVRERHAPPEERLTVVHRGVDLGQFDPAKVGRERVAALRAAWGLARDERKILLLPARLTAWKGQETAVRAARALKEMKFANFVLVLAGSDQGRSGYRARLEAMTAELDLHGTVLLVGHCDDMAAAYMLADVTLVPSTEPEAFGRTAAESQAMGTPVVASALGAVSETVLAPPDIEEDARTGWRVPPGDAAALAAAAAAALSLSPAAGAAMGLRGQAHARASFALERMTASTLAVYDRLLGTRLALGAGNRTVR